MSRKNKRLGGFTITEILILIVIVALLAAVFLRPQYVHNGAPSDANTCINNLRMIDGAKGQWAMDHHKQNSDTPTGSDLQPYMGRGPVGELPVCPNDRKQTFATSYSPNNVGTKPVCKIMPTNHVLP
jgi:competence protein ComGC